MIVLDSKEQENKLVKYCNISYGQKIWRGIKFGGLVSAFTIAKLKICQNFLLAYIRMVIPYQTAN